MDGYARYRIREKWDSGGPESSVVVVEMMATNPSAHLDLWRFLMDIDLMARIEAWNLPADDPILLSVAEPRRLRADLGDALWTRIVDIAPALAARRYASDGRVVFEIADEFCEWNDGVLESRSRTGSGRPAGHRCGRPGVRHHRSRRRVSRRIRLPPARRRGRVRELQPGAIARADALFHTDRPPWCPMVF